MVLVAMIFFLAVEDHTKTNMKQEIIDVFVIFDGCNINIFSQFSVSPFRCLCLFTLFFLEFPSPRNVLSCFCFPDFWTLRQKNKISLFEASFFCFLLLLSFQRWMVLCGLEWGCFCVILVVSWGFGQLASL